jgi:hypothetical protein
MSDLPDFRAKRSYSPEGDANATARFSAWAHSNLDPIVDPEPSDGYGMERLAERDRDRMAARAIKESELIGFWIAWHRVGGFARLERAGWDRSTIFRKIRRFRTFYGIHPDDATFPWLGADFERAWRGDVEPRWRPHYSFRSNPHVLEPEDPFLNIRPRTSDSPE